jgi:hypothetical protein
MVAWMTELLELNGNERLRSVQLRLSKLRLLAGLSAEVFSVEILGPLSATAEKVLGPQR